MQNQRCLHVLVLMQTNLEIRVLQVFVDLSCLYDVVP